MSDVHRINPFCQYFPCHENMEDCTFCYCPLYPCKDETRGKYVKSKKNRIWDCSGCNWIHKKEVVDKIFELIRGKIK